MSDRELLELAAKANRMGAHWEFYDEHRLNPYRVTWGMTNGLNGYWNPLVNDGDALRLAVALGLSITIQPGVYTIAVNLNGSVNEDEDHGTDHYAATRRAIVRTAAKIGEGML